MEVEMAEAVEVKGGEELEEEVVAEEELHQIKW